MKTSWLAALGVQWVPLVGGAASTARLDWIQQPEVRLAQSALALEAARDDGLFAGLRVEEGIFHAGAWRPPRPGSAGEPGPWSSPRGAGTCWGEPAGGNTVLLFSEGWPEDPSLLSAPLGYTAGSELVEVDLRGLPDRLALPRRGRRAGLRPAGGV